MSQNELLSWIHQVLAPGNNAVLWASLSFLLLATAMWAHRRAAAARARAERARRDAERQDLESDSYFMPPPVIEQAVEIADPVELDSLLRGESETVAGLARDQLAAPTDLSMGENTVGPGPATVLPQAAAACAPAAHPGSSAPAQAPRPAPAASREVPPLVAVDPPRRTPPAAPVHASSARPLVAATVAAAPAAPAARVAAQRPAAPVPAAISLAVPAAGMKAEAPRPETPQVPATHPSEEANSERVPLRDLVLTWYEARGYRAAMVSVRFRPIELELRHRSEAERNYAFAVERERLTGARAAALLKLARSAGHKRLLIAAEAGIESDAAQEIRHLGVRVFDEVSIQAELGKVDIRVAAKIIAVARGRNQENRRRSGRASSVAPQPAPQPAHLATRQESRLAVG